MKFQFTSAFTLLLLSASASSFGPNSPKKILRGRSSSSTGLTFVSGGAVSGSTFGTTKLNSAVESDATCIKSTISPENLELLSERGRAAIVGLMENDVDGFQDHVYGNWPEAGVQDEGKKLLTEQVCVGGLIWCHNMFGMNAA